MATLKKLDTIERLKSLKPGEKFVYYKGDLDTDIKNSSEQYRLMLEAIRRVAQRLVKEERIFIFTCQIEIVKGSKKIIISEQVAIGAR